MAKKRRHVNAHDTITIPALYRVLKREAPEDDIWMNFRKRLPVPDTNIYPDVLNETQRIAYEVHWKGKRKEDNFQALPLVGGASMYSSLTFGRPTMCTS